MYLLNALTSELQFLTHQPYNTFQNTIVEMGSLRASSHPEGLLVETDLLVVGAGPAGASLSSFLARYGLNGIMISSAPGTADTPRAHLVNLSALDAMRDIGLQDECYRLGKQGA